MHKYTNCTTKLYGLLKTFCPDTESADDFRCFDRSLLPHKAKRLTFCPCRAIIPVCSKAEGVI